MAMLIHNILVTSGKERFQQLFGDTNDDRILQNPSQKKFKEEKLNNKG